jgi:DNA polymerase
MQENVLIGEGNRQVRLRLLAQVFGETEDRESKMFIDPAGQVLHELSEQAEVRELRLDNVPQAETHFVRVWQCRTPTSGTLFSSNSLSRGDFYITDLLKCKLPQNREPKQDEIDTCRHWNNQGNFLLQRRSPFGAIYTTRYAHRPKD